MDFTNRLPAYMRGTTEAELVDRITKLATAIERPVEVINFVKSGKTWSVFFYLRAPLRKLIKEYGGKI